MRQVKKLQGGREKAEGSILSGAQPLGHAPFAFPWVNLGSSGWSKELGKWVVQSKQSQWPKTMCSLRPTSVMYETSGWKFRWRVWLLNLKTQSYQAAKCALSSYAYKHTFIMTKPKTRIKSGLGVLFCFGHTASSVQGSYSPARDGTHIPCSGSRVSITALAGESQSYACMCLKVGKMSNTTESIISQIRMLR